MTTLLGQEYEDINNAYEIQEVKIDEVTAEDYLNHGFSFLQSACVLNRNVENLGPHKVAPVYFSIIHTYELLLKSFLLYCGYKPKRRHDLEELLDKAKGQGLKISDDHSFEIIELNKFNPDHEFRYPVIGDKFVQDVDSLIHIGKELHSQIVEYARQKDGKC